MAKVDSAVKELFKEELEEVRDAQTKQEGRFTELEKSLQELVEKLEERKTETDAGKEDVEKLRAELEAHDERIKAIEGLDPTALKERVERLESDEDGLGGIKQVHEKMDGITKDFLELQAKFAEVSRIGSAAKTRTDELDLILRELKKQGEDMQVSSTAIDERLKTVELSSSRVSAAQQALEDAVARKHETMWDDVLNAIEELKSSQLQELKQEIDRLQNPRTNVNGMVTYALNAMALAHEERKKMKIGKDLVAAWREQTWACTRRKQGLWRLHNLFQRRSREAVGRWARSAAIAKLSDDIREDTASQISSAKDTLMAADSGLADRCDALQASIQDLQTVTDTMVSVEKLDARFTREVELISSQCDYRFCTKTTHEADVAKVASDGNELLSILEETLTTQIQKSAERFKGLEEQIEERLGSFAVNKDLQDVMRDMLHIWNSIKHMDSTKADKKDVDGFMTNVLERDNTATKRIDGLRIDISERLKSEVAGEHSRLDALEANMNDNVKQAKHWEKMWEQLAGYVEDLVTKVSEIQAEERAAAGGSARGNNVAGANKWGHPVSTMRPPSGGLPRSRPASAERGVLRAGAPPPLPSLPVGLNPNESGIDFEATVDGPTMPIGGIPGVAARGQSPRDAYVDSRMIWASAKGIVDQTMGQAGASGASTPKLKTISRPQSAGRRSVDRARD